MLAKKLLIPLAGVISLGGPWIAQGAATAGTNPNITQVQFAMLAPSTLAKDGGFPIKVAGKVPYGEVCSFDVWVTDQHGGTGWTYEGRHSSSGPDLFFTDYLATVGNGTYRQYQMQAQDCSGNSGNIVESRGFYPTIIDDTDSSSPIGRLVQISSGTSKEAYASSAYGGSYLQTTSGLGTRAAYQDCDHNSYATAIYGSTGPKGGIATATDINGRTTSVNFYSAKIHPRTLLFKPTGYVELKMTKRGAGGGTAMNFDAVAETVDGEGGGC